MEQNLNRDDLCISTKYGDRRLKPAEFDPIFGTKIGRVRKSNGERVRGFYDRPFLCWSAKNKQYSLCRDLHSLLRSVRHAQDWEGGGQEELESSDHQKLLAWLIQHTNLLAWATNMSERELERLHSFCEKRAQEMGRPLDVVKLEIKTLMLRVALAKREDAAGLIEEIIGLDKRRIANIRAIAGRLNVRAAAVLREIITQQDIMKACYDTLPNIVRRHEELLRTHVGRDEHFAEVEALLASLGGIKDRPWYGLARHTERDLRLYLEQTTSGDYGSASMHPRRALASAPCASAIYQVNSALTYLSLARGRNGHRNQELRAKAEGMIIQLAAINTEEGGLLNNNPLPGIKGRAEDALEIMRSEHPNPSDVSDLLKGMNDMLG